MSSATLDWFGLYDLARRQAYRVLGDPHEAEDMAQGALIALLLLDIAGRRPPNPEAWITPVAGNLAKNERRRRERERRAVTRVQAGRVEDFAEEVVDRYVARIIVDELLVHLSERQRQALELIHGKDLKTATVAELLGIEPNSVRKLLKRALAALGDQLRRAHDEDER